MTAFCRSRRRALLGALGATVVVVGGCGRGSTGGPGDVFPGLAAFEPLEHDGAPGQYPAGGEALVVNFWASWCGPCRMEMPALQRLDGLLRATGVRVAAVSIDRDRNLAREFIRGAQIRFPVFYDASGGAATASLGLRALPETFVVDSGGIIRARVSGARDWSNEDSQRLVTDSLRRPGGAAYRAALSPY